MATQTFALDLYRRLPEGNLFFSPFSVRSALGRAAIGARGKTRDELNEVLGLTNIDDAVATWLENLEKSVAGARNVILEVANRIYVQKDYSFVPAYLELMKRSAGFETVDFQRQFEAVREAINVWVEQVTHQKIQNLLGPGALDAFTRMVLVNAIYFKGKWASEFDKTETKDGEFYAPGKTVKVPLMHQKGNYPYTETENMQALRMPYKGNRLGMMVLLPRESISLHDVEQEVTEGDNLKTLLYDLHPEKNVHVYLPRFEINWGTINLVDILKAMGVIEAFDPDVADFTGMVEDDTLFVSGVYHKAYVKTDEEGSEAAAATAVVMTRESFMMPKPDIIFRADRPFMFTIHDSETKEYLFMGRVVNPAK